MKFLKFLNLLDRTKELSLTNLMVWAFSIKLLLMPTVDLQAAAPFFLALLNYGHKRMVSDRRSATLESSNNSLGRVMSQLTEQRQAHEELAKQVTDLKQSADEHSDKLGQISMHMNR